MPALQRGYLVKMKLQKSAKLGSDMARAFHCFFCIVATCTKGQVGW